MEETVGDSDVVGDVVGETVGFDVVTVGDVVVGEEVLV